MITVIPAFEIMKCVVDDNIDTDPAITREKSFSAATDLQSKADVDVLLDGPIFSRIKPKLLPEHIVFFEKTYRIDDSVTGLSEFHHTASVKWIAHSESRSRRVIIISDNVTDYAPITSSRICAVTATDFLEKVDRAEADLASRKYSSLEDSLMAAFF